jgi:hypothetical protein
MAPSRFLVFVDPLQTCRQLLRDQQKRVVCQRLSEGSRKEGHLCCSSSPPVLMVVSGASSPSTNSLRLGGAWECVRAEVNPGLLSVRIYVGTWKKYGLVKLEECPLAWGLGCGRSSKEEIMVILREKLKTSVNKKFLLSVNVTSAGVVTSFEAFIRKSLEERKSVGSHPFTKPIAQQMTLFLVRSIFSVRPVICSVSVAECAVC